MKNSILVTAIILATGASSLAQLHRENILGLDVPAQRWTRSNDMTYFDGPNRRLTGLLSDIANIRFAAGGDTTDIIMAVDYGASRILWLRTPANILQRPVEHIGSYGEYGDSIGQFIAPYPMAVASGDIYDPSTDHIFIGDRMKHSMISLNFDFNPSSPGSDRVIWESSTFVDSQFTPTDMEYVDYSTGYNGDNRLFVLDDIGNRLAVFSHDGDLMDLLDLYDPADSVTHIYWSFAHKANPNGSVLLYLADQTSANVRLYFYSAGGVMSYVNEINIGDRLAIDLSDVIYSDRFGLWVVERNGPHLYKLAENLSRVLFEVSGEEFDPRSLFYPYKIKIFPERLVVFEELNDNTGILSFAFNTPLGKREGDSEEPLPFAFALNQNYPNPFNPTTIVSFEIPSTQHVTLDIFNILGQKVKTLVDEDMSAGRYSLIWDGKNNAGRYISSGIYFSRLSSGDNTEIKKMLLLK